MYKTLLLGLTACFFLSSCEAIELFNSVSSIIGPLTKNAESSASEQASESSSTLAPAPTSTNASPSPSDISGIDVVTSSDPSPVSTDWNIARGKDVDMSVSSTLNPNYAKERLLDGKLETSWFTAASDTPSMGKLPTIELSFAKPVGVLSVNLRGDREKAKGLNIQELSVLMTSAEGVVLNETVKIPANINDVNLVLKKPLNAVSSIRLTITRGVEAPGLAELEILGKP